MATEFSAATMAVAVIIITTAATGLSGFSLFPVSVEITIPAAANQNCIHMKYVGRLCKEPVLRILGKGFSYVLKVLKTDKEQIYEQG